jgi:superfamily II DNA or RNA helicase
LKLRDYQIECINTIHNVKNGEKKLVQSATGSGKTIILAKLSADAKGRVLIVVPSTELREQTEEKLRMLDPEMDIGHVQGSLNETSNKVVVATRQSLTHIKSNRIGDMLQHGKFEFLIFDEAHQAPKQIHKILKQVNKDVKAIGFTATPYTRECIETFGQPIFRRTILDMIDGEFLVEPYAILVKSKTNISHVKTTNGDFAQGDLERAVNNAERNNLIIESYKKYVTDDRNLTLVFAAGCEHGKELLSEFRENGIATEYIDGETPKQQRKEIIDKYKSKKVKVLINVMALSTGFDVPETSVILICRPTKSRILFEQIVGRGLRLADNKDSCMIIDIQDVTKRHDLMNIDTLFNIKMKSGERLTQAKERIEKEKIDEQQRREDQERLRKEKELLKQKELEIVAERIKLINRDMKKGFEDRKFDWFRVGTSAYALAYGFSNYYVVENVNDKFRVYDANTNKESKSIVQIHESDFIIDAIDWAEKQQKINTYSDPKSLWKKDKPTEAQLKFCAWATCKWQVSVYFASSAISGMLANKGRVMV